MRRTHPKSFDPRIGDRLVGRDQEEEEDEEGDEKDEEDDDDDCGYSEYKVLLLSTVFTFLLDRSLMAAIGLEPTTYGL
jgi:hypothetical protein